MLIQLKHRLLLLLKPFESHDLQCEKNISTDFLLLKIEAYDMICIKVITLSSSIYIEVHI